MEGQFPWKVVRSIRHQVESPARQARTRENVVAVGLRDVEQPAELDELLLLNRPASHRVGSRDHRQTTLDRGGGGGRSVVTVEACAERDEDAERGIRIRIWPCPRFS
jgi:hypothetical protein